MQRWKKENTAQRTRIGGLMDIKSSLVCLINKGFNIIPLKQITKDNNEKAHFGQSIPKGWKEIVVAMEKTLKEADNGCFGYLTRPAKSGLVGIDYDPQHIGYNPDVLKRLLNTNTFRIKTPSGGYHFFFKDTPLITKDRNGLFGNYDICKYRGCFFGLRADGAYEIDDPTLDVKEMPNDILQEFLCYNPKDTRQAKEGPCINQDIADKPPPTKFKINDKQLAYILSHIKQDWCDDYIYWEMVSKVLKEYGYKDAWDTWSKQSKLYNKADNHRRWDNFQPSQCCGDINWLINVANGDYKNKYKIKTTPFGFAEVIHSQYEQMSRRTLRKISKTFSRKHLETEDFKVMTEGSPKCLIIKSCMASGKTTNAFKWAIQNNEKVFSIVSLKSLHANQVGTFTKLAKQAGSSAKMISYMTTSEYSGVYLDKYASVCTTVHSMIKTRRIINDISNYYMYMDEIKRTVKDILTSNTIKNRKDIINELIGIVRDCKGIIATDGGIDDISVDFLEAITKGTNKEIVFYENTNKYFNGVKATLYREHATIWKKMREFVANKKVFTLACNTKKMANQCRDMLLQTFGVDPSIVKIYTSKEGETITDATKAWDKCYVIYSPTIVEGVDRTSATPETVFVLISTNATMDPEQISQMIARNRSIKEVFIGLKSISNKMEYESPEDLNAKLWAHINGFYDAFKDVFKRSADPEINGIADYKEMLDNNDGTWVSQTERTAEQRFTDNDFSNLYKNTLWRRSDLCSSYISNLVAILQNAGFSIIDHTNDIDVVLADPGAVKTEKDIKAIEPGPETDARIEAFYNGENNPKDPLHEGMERRCRYAMLTYDKAKPFNAIIVDDNKEFSQYLSYMFATRADKDGEDDGDNICKLIARDYKDVISKGAEQSRVSYLRLMRLYLADKNPFYLSIDERDADMDDAIDMTDTDFNSLCLNYSVSMRKTKKQKPKTKRELSKMMVVYAKKVFGKDAFITTRAYTYVDKKTVAYSITTPNYDHINHIISLCEITNKERAIDNKKKAKDQGLDKWYVPTLHKDVVKYYKEPAVDHV